MISPMADHLPEVNPRSMDSLRFGCCFLGIAERYPGEMLLQWM